MTLKPYLLEIHGITHSVLLSDEDAKRRGLFTQVTVVGLPKLEAEVPEVRVRPGRKRLPRDADGNIIRVESTG